VAGRRFWEDLAADARLGASFASLMEAHSAELADDVVAGYPWAGQTLVVDVGGGTGTLLARILSAHPHLRGILVDLVSGSPEAARVLQEAGVADRCQPVVADFFGPLPVGGDVYLLRNIIHDWPDEQAVAVLRRCAEAAGPAEAAQAAGPAEAAEAAEAAGPAGAAEAAGAGGRVLVVERVVSQDGNRLELTAMDLRMMLLFGSRERSAEEFSALAGAAGLRLVTARPTSSSYWLLEYAPGPPG
jgi:2,7-dihydroxy-5-methyl-1-naphthoate 7-O-methyltransferase